MLYQIKLLFTRWITDFAGRVVAALTYKTHPDHFYKRINKLEKIFYPALRSIYNNIRPKAHHYTFRLQLYKSLLSQLQIRHCGFMLPVRVENEAALLQSLQNRTPSLIVSPHLRLTTILGYYLEQEGYRLAVLAHTDPNPSGLNFGMKSPLDFITSNLGCLLEIRRRFKSGIPVLAMPDYERRNNGNQLTKYISPNIFKMAETLSASVTFMWVDMDDEGTVLLRFKSMGTGKAADMAAQFCHFVSEHSPWVTVVREPH